MRIKIKGEKIVDYGYEKDCELIEITEQGKCENCNKEGEVFVIEYCPSGVGLCHKCLLKNYEGCEFEEVRT